MHVKRVTKLKSVSLTIYRDYEDSQTALIYIVSVNVMICRSLEVAYGS